MGTYDFSEITWPILCSWLSWPFFFFFPMEKVLGFHQILQGFCESSQPTLPPKSLRTSILNLPGSNFYLYHFQMAILQS